MPATKVKSDWVSGNLVFSQKTAGGSGNIQLSGVNLIGVGYTQLGKILYVDTTSWGAGSNSNAGTDPSYPLATITYALSLCSANKHDYIFVLNGYDNDAVTVAMTKAGVHIIGVGPNNHSAPLVWLKIGGTGDAAVFTMTPGSATSCEIAGFCLAADATHPCITFASSTGTYFSDSWIHHNAFAGTSDVAFLAQDGITVPAEANGLLIEDNTFGQELGRDGIRAAAISYGMIRNNVFVGYVGVGVNITGGGAEAMPHVIGNLFYQKTTQDAGSSIQTLTAGGGIIDGNHTVSNGGHAGNNPYRDTTTGTDTSTKNGWGVNYLGDAVKYPAFT